MKVKVTKLLIHSANYTDEDKTTQHLELEVPGTLFTIELDTEGKDGLLPGTWDETYGSRYEVELFMRGFQAGMAMNGQMMPLNYEIPR